MSILKPYLQTFFAFFIFLSACTGAIAADKTPAQKKHTKNTITVQGTHLANLNSLYDVLKKTPSVTINKKNIPIVNGIYQAALYINGRKVNDLTELKRISAGKIKSITVITNPGAEYSGDYQAVIDVKKIQSLEIGYKIYDQLELSYNKYMGVHNNLAVDVTRDKLSLNGTFTYNYSNTDYDLEEFYDTFSNNQQGDKILDTRNYYKIFQNIKIKEFTLELEGEYKFSKNHALTLRYEFYNRGKYRKENNPQINEFYQRADKAQIDLENPTAVKTTYGLDNRPIHRHSIHLGYKGTVKGWTFNGFVDFFHNAEGQYATANPIEDFTLITKDLCFERSQQNYNIKGMAKHNIGKGEILLGGEMNFINHVNFYDDFKVENDRTHATISDNTYGLFLNLTQDFGLLDLDASIRYDHRVNSYIPKDDDQTKQQLIDTLSKYNLGNSLPHNYLTTDIVLSKTISQVQTTLSYNLSYIKPFKKFQRITSDELENLTNILLKTEFQHTLALGAAWKWFNFKVYYTHYKSPIFETMSSIKSYNGPDYNSIGLQAIASYKKSFWSSSLSLYLHKQWLNMETVDGTSNLKKPRLITMFVNTFALPWGITLDLTANWETRGAKGSIMNYTNYFNMDASLYKELYNGKLSIMLTGENILGTACIDATRYTPVSTKECGGDKKHLPTSVILSLKVQL